MKKLVILLFLILNMFMVTSCAKNYVLTYYDGDKEIYSEELKTGEEITFIDGPEKEGYTFIEWRYEDNKKFTGGVMPENDLNIYAYYEESNVESMERVVINLADGRKIKLELYPDVAPITVENFLKLVDANYYDGVIFHRVIENFMIQTGGYYIEGDTLREKPRLDPIKGEFSENGVENSIKHEPGVISMARTSVPDSATSQFFICSATSPHLDGSYAAFGRVIDDESLQVVMDISRVQTGYFNPMFENFPYEPIVIESIERL